ncbi:MAG TPA: GGDEF domain-containing protein [Caulobacteraceae bacterium]|nr:GGDEF domain-containing protein [Caulobacteraceae bacterium]
MTASGACSEPQVPSDATAMAREIEDLRAQVKALSEQLAEAERLADGDSLTPLLNRRAFMREVQRAIAVARRHQIPASLIYFDLDGFKGVNDRFGHAAGDAALLAVAERLLAEVRESDVVGRLGGDEFAVLLLHADREAATHKAEALRARVIIEPVQFEALNFHIGVTYGVREIAGADSAEQALAEADAAMYLRKPAKP